MTEAGLSIRLALANEQGALEALQRAASFANPDYRDALLAFPDAIELPLWQIEAGRVLVAGDETGVTGFAAWIDGDAPGEAELDGLFVAPELWRGGIGRALVVAAAEAARAAGKARMTVVANPSATAFYQHCGFAFVGETETRFGPAPVMAMALARTQGLEAR